ncbi:MAG TPA: response regulator [Haliangium sp.]|nr:response regulator [Haliangium sp.]
MAERRNKRESQRLNLEYRPPPGFRDGGEPLFTPGTVVANTYQIRSLITTTRTGQLFEARDMPLERPVAIRANWRDGDVPSQLSEARALARIHDPCVAQIYAFGHHQEIEYVCAERVEGMSLSDAVSALYDRGQRLAIADVIESLTRLAHGLQVLHRVGLWAPRLSSKTLVVGRGQRLVMSEFALGQGAAEGEALCLAPEVINGVRGTDIARAAEAIDLYALGCIAVELLVGSPPFASATLMGLQQAHVYAPPPKLTAIREDMPRELADLVDELLAKRAQDRPASAEAVIQQLDVIRMRMTVQRMVRVLLVDREHGRRARLASALRRAHAALQIEVARDADVALSCIKEAAPDVLVFDMQLEGSMNGLELCMYVRGLESMHDAVLVALCDEIKDADTALLQQLGVAHVVERNASLERALVDIAVRSVSGSGSGQRAGVAASRGEPRS